MDGHASSRRRDTSIEFAADDRIGELSRPACTALKFRAQSQMLFEYIALSVISQLFADARTG